MRENREENYDPDDGSINVMNFEGTYRKILVVHGAVRTDK
ncbi:hypothetical protein M2263_001523 [Providencia alcalifaciens]|nr:hypothetical protein [Providencia alcalifaciens]